jgi:hypothetical protein
MFPETHNMDTAAFESSGDTAVSKVIPVYLFTPVRTVLFGHATASWTLVPEAAIHENRQLPAREIEIRTARQVSGVQSPTPNSRTHKRKTQTLLG